MKLTTLVINSCLMAAAVCGQSGIGQDKQAAAAPAPNPNLTRGNLNGRGWLALSDSERQSFIQGYQQGATFVSYNVSNNEQNAFRVLLTKYWPYGLTPAKVKTELDQFFATPENRPITIASAVWVLSLQRAGATDAELQKHIDRFRSEK